MNSYEELLKQYHEVVDSLSDAQMTCLIHEYRYAHQEAFTDAFYEVSKELESYFAQCVDGDTSLWLIRGPQLIKDRLIAIIQSDFNDLKESANEESLEEIYAYETACYNKARM